VTTIPQLRKAALPLPEMAARAAEAETAEPGEVGDLPKGIGRPATRALTAIGVTTLAQVARLSDAELLAVHGVGPKAVRVLRAALER
jgi:predicted flap endonuclease-1-like 5' DNA nuclease